MPVVPRKERTAVTAPLPSGGLPVTLPDIGVSRAAGEGAALVAEIHEKETKSVNNTAVTAAIADLSAFDTDLKHNIDTGLLNTKNETAFNVNTEASEAYDKYRAETLAGFANDRQRELFIPHIDRAWANTDQLTKKHAVSQKDSFQVEQVNTLLTRVIASAAEEYDNPESIGLSIGTFVQAYVETAADQDIDPDSEQYQAGLRNGINGIHQGVINAMLADKESTMARKYHEENGDAIFNDDAIVKALKAGELVEASTIKAAEIIKLSAPGDITEGLTVEGEGLNRTRANELIGNLKDPEGLPGFKAAVRKLINTHFKDAEAARKAVSFESAEEGARIMELPVNEGRTTAEVLEVLPLWGRLLLKEKKALKSMFDKKQSEKTDETVLLEFLERATGDIASKKEVAEMTAFDIENLSAPLNDRDKGRVIAYWKEARNDVAAAEKAEGKPVKTSSLLSALQLANTTWTANRLPEALPNMTKKEKTEINAEKAEYLRNIEIAFNKASSVKGDVLTQEEERKLVDEVLLQTVEQKTVDPFFGAKKVEADVRRLAVDTFEGEIAPGDKLLIANPIGSGTLFATMGDDGVLRVPHPETGVSVPVDELQPKFTEEQTATLADGTPIVFKNGVWQTVEAK